MGDADAISLTFAALADPTRRAILSDLSDGELTVNELVERHHLTQPAISKHLKVLEGAGLISRGRSAQTRPCRINGDGMKTAVDWLATYRRFWSDAFDNMDALLARIEEGKRQ